MIFKNKFFLIGLVFIIVYLYLFVITPFFTFNSNIYVTYLLQMDKCFRDLQIPCRWVPDLGGSYGYPLFHYYAPLPYYFGELIFFLSGNSVFSTKVIFTLSFIGAYIFMFRLTSFAFLYVLLSFVLQIFFPQDGLGISLALMFFPLVLLNLKFAARANRIQNFLMCALYLAFLILSTNLYPIFTGVFLIWLIYQYSQVRKNSFLFLSLCSLLLAFLLTSFYLLPSIWERNLIHNVSLTDSFYLLPKSVREAPRESSREPYQILTGDSDINNFQKGTNWFKFQTDTRYHTIIRLSQFYFPQWRIFVDGKEANVEYANNSLGLMTIILGEGKHTVEGKLFDTTIRTVANTITVGSSLIFIILFTLQFKKIRSWLEYYRKRVS